MLLPNRPVAMNSFTLKKAVMHHAEPKQQDQDKENDHEDRFPNSRQGRLRLRVAFQIRIRVHRSCHTSNSAPKRDNLERRFPGTHSVPDISRIRVLALLVSGLSLKKSPDGDRFMCCDRSPLQPRSYRRFCFCDCIFSGQARIKRGSPQAGTASPRFFHNRRVGPA